MGIELLASLHGAALAVKRRYDEEVAELLNSCQVGGREGGHRSTTPPGPCLPACPLL